MRDPRRTTRDCDQDRYGRRSHFGAAVSVEGRERNHRPRLSSALQNTVLLVYSITDRASTLPRQPLPTTGFYVGHVHVTFLQQRWSWSAAPHGWCPSSCSFKADYRYPHACTGARPCAARLRSSTVMRSSRGLLLGAMRRCSGVMPGIYLHPIQFTTFVFLLVSEHVLSSRRRGGIGNIPGAMLWVFVI